LLDQDAEQIAMTLLRSQRRQFRQGMAGRKLAGSLVSVFGKPLTLSALE